MTVDALYGAGSLAALQAAIAKSRSGGTVTEHDNGDGTVHVEIVWGGDVLRADLAKTEVRISYLSTMCHSDPRKRESGFGTSKGLNAHIVPFLKALGIKKITAAPLDQPSTTAITGTGGYAANPAGGLSWTL